MSDPTTASGHNSGRAPRWNLDSVFPGFDSSEYRSAKSRLSALAREVPAHMEKAGIGRASEGQASEGCACEGRACEVRAAVPDFSVWLQDALALLNEADLYSRTLSSYCYAIYSTNTADKRAMNEINAIEEMCVPFARAEVLFLNALSAHEDEVREAVSGNPEIAPYSFYLEDALFWQKKQMSAAEEDLAADLARTGADAWGRLQEQITSGADCLWDEASGERKTLVDLRSLAYDKDRSVREKAFHKELEICASAALPVASALNGIKGTAVLLNRRRGWTGTAGSFPLDPALEKSVAQGRLSPKALEALIGAMEDSLPHWRRYLKAKAKIMGIPACAFYDLFAPIGGKFPQYDWETVRSTVVSSFESFSPRLGAFARRAFESGWIDAESRSGKVSGAYCTDMPLVRETRVLANFDGAFNSVTTVAHELGHAFHSNVVMELPPLQQDYPMTLAETASIFAETIVFNDVLAKASAEEKLGLIEAHLQDGCQILVDILSRFYFERSVFADRASGELSAEDLCAKMREAQLRTYGDGLDSSLLHPYMWLVKIHYYSSDLSFYNFPYAFGQLFGMALYARYKSEGSGFASVYEDLLRETGRMDAVSLTARAGFDIESREFWQNGIDLFIREIDEFERLADASGSKK